MERVFVTVDECVGIDDVDFEKSVWVYPNPTDGKFILEMNGLENEINSARIYDVTGKITVEKIVSVESKNSSINFDLSGFSRGLYYLKLDFANGIVIRKIVLQ